MMAVLGQKATGETLGVWGVVFTVKRVDIGWLLSIGGTWISLIVRRNDCKMPGG